MSNRVGNPEYRISRDAAHVYLDVYGCVFRREALFYRMCLFLIRQKVVTVQKTCHEETNFLPKPVFGGIQPGPTQTGL